MYRLQSTRGAAPSLPSKSNGHSIKGGAQATPMFVFTIPESSGTFQARFGTGHHTWLYDTTVERCDMMLGDAQCLDFSWLSLPF